MPRPRVAALSVVVVLMLVWISVVASTGDHCPLSTARALADETESAEPFIDYSDHRDLMQVRDAAGARQSIRTVTDWERRRRHVVVNLQRVTGSLPNRREAVPLDLKTVAEVRVGDLVRRKITFQSDAQDRVPAYVMFPPKRFTGKRPAMLCLHQTTAVGKDEPAGIRGAAHLKYALELVERGYVMIVPDYPSFGEHAYDFQSHPEYISGTLKAVWDNIRAVDVLETLAEVDRERIGVIGHSLGGHNAMFTAVFEPRLKVIVSSCGFTTFRKDDLPSWTGPTYMPRIASLFANDVTRVPFDFEEIVAAFAPRPFFASAAERDNDFDVSGVREVMESAAMVYRLHGVGDRLAAFYPPTEHAFPPEARQKSYEFLDRYLKP